MTKQVCLAVVLGLAAIALAWPVEGAEPVQQDAEAAKRDQAFKDAMAQMKEIDEKSYEHLIHLPDSFDFAGQEAVIRQVAAKFDEIGESHDFDKIEIKPVAGTDRLRLADGRPSPIEISRLDISGRAPFGSVHALLSWLQIRTWRFAELDSLQLRAEEDGTVRFDVRLAYPNITEWPEDQEEQRATRSPDDMLTRMVDKRRLLLELLEDLSARSHFARLVDALAVFGVAIEEKALGLTEVRYDGVAVIRGFALGSSALDGLRPALEKAGFLVQDVKTSPLGSCQAFTVTSEVKPAEPSEEFAMANGLFEPRTAAFCERAAAAGSRVTARGTAPAGQALTLHLRDLEMVDLFIVLNELTSASFLMDHDVEGRISLDVESATLDEVLAALGSAGVAVSPGPVRQVTRAGKPPAAAAPADYCAEPMSIKNRNASLTETLCVLSQVAQRPILAPADLRGTVHMYGTDLRTDQIIEALAASAGLVSMIDGDHLLLGRGTAAEIRSRKDAINVCEIRDDSPGSPRLSRLDLLSQNLKSLGAGDLELAGVARQGETWTAYAFTPTRKLRTLKTGERLLDAKVNAIGLDGVTFATEASGTVKLTLRP